MEFGLYFVCSGIGGGGAGKDLIRSQHGQTSHSAKSELSDQ